MIYDYIQTGLQSYMIYFTYITHSQLKWVSPSPPHAKVEGGVKRTQHLLKIVENVVPVLWSHTSVLGEGWMMG